MSDPLYKIATFNKNPNGPRDLITAYYNPYSLNEHLRTIAEGCNHHLPVAFTHAKNLLDLYKNVNKWPRVYALYVDLQGQVQSMPPALDFKHVFTFKAPNPVLPSPLLKGGETVSL